MTAEPLRVLTLCGSLRKGSYNRALLGAARELAPEGLALVDGPELGALPHYNADLDGDDPPPEVREFRRHLREAEALIVASPEYNYGIPGVMKNAIDWGSRPAKDMPISGLPTLLLGASGGAGGTMRVQLALRQCFVATSTPVLLQPGFYLARAAERFEDGRLTHEETRKFLARTLEVFAPWAREMRRD
jgi:chromate reductase, NAD(P)H dehydrogenase (quinone)